MHKTFVLLFNSASLSSYLQEYITLSFQRVEPSEKQKKVKKVMKSFMYDPAARSKLQTVDRHTELHVHRYIITAFMDTVSIGATFHVLKASSKRWLSW